MYIVYAALMRPNQAETVRSAVAYSLVPYELMISVMYMYMLLASFFFPSHLSFKNMYIYMYVYIYYIHMRG